MKEFNIKLNIDELRILSSLLRKDIFQMESGFSNYSIFGIQRLLPTTKSLLERIDRNIEYVSNLIINKKSEAS